MNTQTNLRRQFGLFVPVSALAGGHGIGDVLELTRTIDYCARLGIGALQISPINETGGDNCPDIALSSRALEPAFLHMAPGWVPEFDYADSEGINYMQLNNIINGEMVDYPLVKSLKRALLRRAFTRFESQGKRTELQRFEADNQDWLRVYSLFRVLMQRYSTQDFSHWPQAGTYEEGEEWLARQPALVKERIARERRFETFVQWVAHRQWEEAKRYATEGGRVQIIGNMPCVSTFSADLWGPDRILFERTPLDGALAEADSATNNFGRQLQQSWAVPRWARHSQTRYAWLRRCVKGISTYCHLLDNGFARQVTTTETREGKEIGAALAAIANEFGTPFIAEGLTGNRSFGMDRDSNANYYCSELHIARHESVMQLPDNLVVVSIAAFLGLGAQCESDEVSGGCTARLSKPLSGYINDPIAGPLLSAFTGMLRRTGRLVVS